RRQRLPAGWQRMYSLGFSVQPAPLPRLYTEVVTPLADPDGLEELIDEAALAARDCLPGDNEESRTWTLEWRTRAGQTRLQSAWLPDPKGQTVPRNAAQCIAAELARRTLPRPATADSVGLVRYVLAQPDKGDRVSAPQPTIVKGYELLVSAEVGGEPIGQTRLRMDPGSVPDLRLRAAPVLAEPGQKITVSLLRGPEFTGTLPKKLSVSHFDNREDLELDPDTRTASFAIPDDGAGWYEIAGAGQRALVYVRPERDLRVSVNPDQPRYAPGSDAILRIQTEVAGTGSPAAVGLFGVDDSLGQLVPLPGPDAMNTLQPEIAMHEQVFGMLDGRALTLGRIRGANAAEATILRVAQVPRPADLDIEINAAAETALDPIAELTDRFYIILTELHAQTRQWESSAPDATKMKPETMASLWNKAIDAVAERGGQTEDAFGRRLRLHYLPDDLLALTDPRQVVVVGTRLPEDVENWQQWVRRTRP
ncbi:MAG: hypothetical protein AAGC55_20725, partial [Myxococcota bacterium]